MSRAAAPRLTLAICPLTPDLWPALEDLFANGGACSRCWCMYPRLGGAYRNRPPEQNRADLRRIVERGPPPGLLAFAGDTPVGWCQVTPRAALPWFDARSPLKPVDDAPVWSLSCFYIRKGWRRKGVTAQLIAAAVTAAKRAKAPALEAYPLDAARTTSTSYTGYASTFARAGFHEVARHKPPRPIMRHDLDASSKRKAPATRR